MVSTRVHKPVFPLFTTKPIRDIQQRRCNIPAKRREMMYPGHRAINYFPSRCTICVLNGKIEGIPRVFLKLSQSRLPFFFTLTRRSSSEESTSVVSILAAWMMARHSFSTWLAARRPTFLILDDRSWFVHLLLEFGSVTLKVNATRRTKIQRKRQSKRKREKERPLKHRRFASLITCIFRLWASTRKSWFLSLSPSLPPYDLSSTRRIRNLSRQISPY